MLLFYISPSLCSLSIIIIILLFFIILFILQHNVSFLTTLLKLLSWFLTNFLFLKLMNMSSLQHLTLLTASLETTLFDFCDKTLYCLFLERYLCSYLFIFLFIWKTHRNPVPTGNSLIDTNFFQVIMQSLSESETYIYS